MTRRTARQSPDQQAQHTTGVYRPSPEYQQVILDLPELHDWLICHYQHDEKESVRRLIAYFEVMLIAAHPSTSVQVAIRTNPVPPINCSICRREVPSEEYYANHYKSHPCE